MAVATMSPPRASAFEQTRRTSVRLFEHISACGLPRHANPDDDETAEPGRIALAMIVKGPVYLPGAERRRPVLPRTSVRRPRHRRRRLARRAVRSEWRPIRRGRHLGPASREPD